MQIPKQTGKNNSQKIFILKKFEKKIHPGAPYNMDAADTFLNDALKMQCRDSILGYCTARKNEKMKIVANI